MDTTTDLLLLVTPFICVIITKTIRKKRSKASGAPLRGPKRLPVIGNALDVEFQSLHTVPFFRSNYWDKLSSLLSRKAYSSSAYGRNFNDRPDAFFGKYVCFDCSDYELKRL